MKIAAEADVKARLSAYLNESQHGPVIITRNGKAVAVLLAVTDEDELERLVIGQTPGGVVRPAKDKRFRGAAKCERNYLIFSMWILPA